MFWPDNGFINLGLSLLFLHFINDTSAQLITEVLVFLVVLIGFVYCLKVANELVESRVRELSLLLETASGGVRD